MDSNLSEHLIRLVSKLLGADSKLPVPFPVERQLSDLGLSSLKLVNLMLAIEMEFDVVIPPADITPETFHSVATIAALVQRLQLPGLTAR
jgi:acyl carrier protein